MLEWVYYNFLIKRRATIFCHDPEDFRSSILTLISHPDLDPQEIPESPQLVIHGEVVRWTAQISLTGRKWKEKPVSPKSDGSPLYIYISWNVLRKKESRKGQKTFSRKSDFHTNNKNVINTILRKFIIIFSSKNLSNGGSNSDYHKISWHFINLKGNYFTRFRFQ